MSLIFSLPLFLSLFFHFLMISFHIFSLCSLFFDIFFLDYFHFLGKKSGLSQCTQVLYYCTTKMTHKLHFSSKLSTIIKCTFSSQFFNLGNLNFCFYFAATRQSDGLQMEDTNSRKKSRQEVGCSLTSLNNHTFWKKQKFKHHHEEEEEKKHPVFFFFNRN